jgi:hypothetical protein
VRDALLLQATCRAAVVRLIRVIRRTGARFTARTADKNRPLDRGPVSETSTMMAVVERRCVDNWMTLLACVTRALGRR